MKDDKGDKIVNRADSTGELILQTSVSNGHWDKRYNGRQLHHAQPDDLAAEEKGIHNLFIRNEPTILTASKK